MKLTALSVMAFAASGLAQSTKNHCNTSGASPMLHHVQAVIDNTGNAGFGEQVCLQYALGSDDCTGTIKDYSGKGGGAALMMCKGPGKEQTYRVKPHSTFYNSGSVPVHAKTFIVPEYCSRLPRVPGLGLWASV